MRSVLASVFNRNQTFAIVVGLTDGILTALTLASGHLLTSTRPTWGLSLRIAAGSAICGIFVFFTAEYARLRGELLHAERQLNLSSSGQFVTSQLGKQVRADALASAVISSTANFLGALFPLCLGSMMPGRALLAVVPPIAALGVLGIALAKIVMGNTLIWIAALVASGVALSLIGAWLHIA